VRAVDPCACLLNDVRLSKEYGKPCTWYMFADAVFCERMLNDKIYFSRDSFISVLEGSSISSFEDLLYATVVTGGCETSVATNL
jgi:hypothetical protein